MTELVELEGELFVYKFSSLTVDDEVPVVGPLVAFRVAGNLDFALVGILASITAPLAAAEISVFSVSTYNTDYLLVKAFARSTAIAAWNAAGIAVGVC